MGLMISKSWIVTCCVDGIGDELRPGCGARGGDGAQEVEEGVSRQPKKGKSLI